MSSAMAARGLASTLTTTMAMACRSVSLGSLPTLLTPGSGATLVWPGSHRRLFPPFSQQCMNGRIGHGGELITGQPTVIAHGDDENSPYADELWWINDDTQPVECHGKCGDIFLWHHRTLDSASVEPLNCHPAGCVLRFQAH